MFSTPKAIHMKCSKVPTNNFTTRRQLCWGFRITCLKQLILVVGRHLHYMISRQRLILLLVMFYCNGCATLVYVTWFKSYLTDTPVCIYWRAAFSWTQTKFWSISGILFRPILFTFVQVYAVQLPVQMAWNVYVTNDRTPTYYENIYPSSLWVSAIKIWLHC